MLVFFVLFLEPSPWHAARVFYDRTVGFQIGRDSPFSLWDWGQYHAKGLPDLHLVQRVLEVLLVVGSLALAWVPRRRSPLRMAALTGAVLIGFELVLTHWFYLYLPWFFPFVALALVAPLPGECRRRKGRTLTRPRLPSAEALAAGGLFLACWGLVHRWFWAHGQLVDWPTYQNYGDAILHHGRVPYRDFAVEYPPGALPPFVAAAPFGDYAGAFAWVMAACGVALVFVVARIRPAAAFFVAVSPVLVGSLILSRFDLWPALLATAAVAALVAERHRLGWALLGAAVAAKLWPLVLVPLALVWSIRRGRGWSALAGRRGRSPSSSCRSSSLAPHGIWTSLRGQASRPLQIESLGAALFTTFGHPHVISSHGSQNVAGHGGVAALFTVAQVAVLLALWIAFARGPATRERFLRYSAAAVCAFIAFGKVLSPQFLLWLVPLVPLVRGRRGLAATLLLTLALVLTQVWFPQRYWDYADSFHLAGVVLARDLVLVALLAVLVLPFGAVRRRATSL